MYEDELLQAIQDAQSTDVHATPDDGLTATEIAGIMDIGVGSVRRTLKILIASGAVENVWVYRSNVSTPLTGRVDKRPGFRYVNNKDE